MLKIKVLIIDDSPKKIDKLKEILNRKDMYILDYAVTGKTALGKIKECNYNLVILDYLLPDMKGHEIAVEIKKILNIPIILNTVLGIDEKYNSLFSGFISQIDNDEKIYSVIRNVLKNRNKSWRYL